MSGLTERVASVRTAIKALRDDLPAIEWRTAQMLGHIQTLADLVAEVASGATEAAAVTATADRERKASERAATVDHLLWLAVRALPPGLAGERRDAEVCRVLASWGVTAGELQARGYGGRSQDDRET